MIEHRMSMFARSHTCIRSTKPPAHGARTSEELDHARRPRGRDAGASPVRLRLPRTRASVVATSSIVPQSSGLVGRVFGEAAPAGEPLRDLCVVCSHNARDHHREAERLSAGARARCVGSAARSPASRECRKDGVVLVGETNRRRDGARSGSTAHDDRWTWLLVRPRPDVVGASPLPVISCQLRVEFVEPLASRGEVESVAAVLGLVPASADSQLDTAV